MEQKRDGNEDELDLGVEENIEIKRRLLPTVRATLPSF